MKQKHDTREGWLEAAIQEMTPWIEVQGHELPEILVSVGFPKGARGKSSAIGQCWYANCDEGEHNHIFVSPELRDEPRILDVLLHEMCHAALGGGVGHKAPFKKLATSVGLEGKMTATVASDGLNERLAALVKGTLGPIPHSKLTPGSGIKKQTTRLLKVECEACGYIARVTAKWLEQAGAPICPCNHEPMVADELGEIAGMFKLAV